MALSWSLSVFFLLTVLLCVALGYLLPPDLGHFLARIVPVFDWREPSDIVLGAVGAFACGWYTALVAGGLYNLFRGRR
ncbi:conserved hypothetical protein (plasmid) [Phenylobacterium zucineum HLK1]|uniref:Uncharacterized protein n=1 Tax=Phenylobacterium zucineum (strain HLK1) TaxID=450851 RepID=B4RIC7_PHEZH|nr:hypothetical protein [Phenylobacterium zucineum]ACG80102.1 conserved hypothetical protein [Phenylobacterium zucineum HLK1]